MHQLLQSRISNVCECSIQVCLFVVHRLPVSTRMNSSDYEALDMSCFIHIFFSCSLFFCLFLYPSATTPNKTVCYPPLSLYVFNCSNFRNFDFIFRTLLSFDIQSMDLTTYEIHLILSINSPSFLAIALFPLQVSHWCFALVVFSNAKKKKKNVCFMASNQETNTGNPWVLQQVLLLREYWKILSATMIVFIFLVKNVSRSQFPVVMSLV